MPSETETLLNRDPLKSFKAGETAERLRRLKGEVVERLKRLAEDKRMTVKRGIRSGEDLSCRLHILTARTLGETA